MPELPEVECIRRGLVRAKVLAPITSIWRSDLPLRTGATWRREQLQLLRRATPVRWRRRGKFLVWQLRRDDVDIAAVIHLGMTGQLSVVSRAADVEPHTHLRVRMADDRELRLVDVRRFGGVHCEREPDVWDAPPLCELGPEPLHRGFDGRRLHARAGHSRRALHDVLLDQRVVAGVGNIYAAEALFLAGLHPRQRADRLRAPAWDRLAAAVVKVLQQGIRNGGTSFRDYRNASGRRGRNQDALWVYGRAGQPCRRCGAALRATDTARVAVWCPRAQPRRRVE